jgi:hypothetical protein
MDEVRAAIAKIVQGHLDEILVKTMDAFDAGIPSVANASPDVRELVRESTRRAVTSFFTLYADETSPGRETVGRARRATIERAGELFEKEDILAMMRIARQVIYQTARTYVRRQVEVDPELSEEIVHALDGFMNELERVEELLPRTPDAVEQFLRAAESEGTDIE